MSPLRASSLAAAVLIASTMAAQVLPRPVVGRTADEANVSSPLADGCATTSLSCNSLIDGELGAGDCTAADGTYLDLLEFTPPSDQVVTLRVWPRSTTYTNPMIRVLAPDDSMPIVSGGPASSAARAVTTLGPWRAVVTSGDIASRGKYTASLTCEVRKRCWNQPVLCGQTVVSRIRSQDCSTLAFGRRFVQYNIYASSSDHLSIDLVSSDFDPAVHLWDPWWGFVDRDLVLTPSKAHVTYLPYRTDLLGIVVTSSGRTAAETGTFALTVRCESAGCLPPDIVTQPSNMTVPFNSTATLSAAAVAVGKVDYVWYDGVDMPTMVGTGPKLVTPPITTPRTFFVTAQTPCGLATGKAFVVTPEPPRPRAVRVPGK